MAGLSAGEAVLATLAYRLVSYWPPIPLGVVAYGLHRRHLPGEGVAVERLPEFVNQASLEIADIEAGSI